MLIQPGKGEKIEREIHTCIFLSVSMTWQPSLEFGHFTLSPRISRLAKLSGNSWDSVIGMLSIGHLWSDSLTTTDKQTTESKGESSRNANNH